MDLTHHLPESYRNDSKPPGDHSPHAAYQHPETTPPPFREPAGQVEDADVGLPTSTILLASEPVDGLLSAAVMTVGGVLWHEFDKKIIR